MVAMNPDSRTRLKSLLVKHEQYKQFPTVDASGHSVVGIGRNLTFRGISPTESLYLLDDDIIYFTSKLHVIIPFYTNIEANRQIALIDICFNVGLNGLLELSDFLRHLEAKDYKEAAKELLNSNHATNDPDRYNDLANIIMTGEI